MIIDGRALAADVLARTKEHAAELGRALRILAIVANETPATKSYLAIKAKRAIDAGCVLEVRQFPESVSTEELQSAIITSDADAIIIQLPLPESIDTKAVCDLIPIGKDADVLSRAARERFERGDVDALLPPVVGAVQEIFAQNSVEVKGKNAVVVGAGFLVGAPVATWLAQKGAEVNVVTVENSTEEITAALRAVDIIITGAGSPHFIQPEMIQDGVVLVDAGTAELGGRVVGDADPACAPKCSLFTPVPGGVGPLAVAKLFENAVILAERAS